ncbi:MAG: ATPase [Spirochaetales bacterium]|nr:ATPase [Spirochaetales bacterium]
MNPTYEFKRKVLVTLVVMVALMGVFAFIGAPNLYAEAGEQDSAVVAVQGNSDSMKWGLIAAAIAFGFGAIGAGIAIANVGAAAMGAIAEKPELASQALIFIALAEGLVVFGFITALMILGKV